MDINYWAILVCGILAMIIGYVWYGPIFGKKWAEIVGADMSDMATREKMQKSAMPLYIVQFIMTLFQVYVLAYYINNINQISGLHNALWVWAGFIIPIVAGSAMWNNDSSKVAWTRFFIQAGYQLVIFVIFGIILALWK